MKRWEERGKQVRAQTPKSFYNHLDNNNFLLTRVFTLRCCTYVNHKCTWSQGLPETYCFVLSCCTKHN